MFHNHHSHCFSAVLSDVLSGAALGFAAVSAQLVHAMLFPHQTQSRQTHPQTFQGEVAVFAILVMDHFLLALL